MKSAGEIIEIAGSYVGGPRNETHGSKGVCFGAMNAADDFITELNKAGTAPPGVESALRMVLYKMARIYAGGKHNLDDYIDMAGYAGCAGELAEAAQSKGE